MAYCLKSTKGTDNTVKIPCARCLPFIVAGLSFLKPGLTNIQFENMTLVATAIILGSGFNLSCISRMWLKDKVVSTYAKDKKGKVLLVLPADYILWSKGLAGGTARIKETIKGDTFELWTAGGVSKKAENNLSKAGWVIHTNVWSKLSEKKIG